jgi:two-component system NtrC family response regulator
MAEGPLLRAADFGLKPDGGQEEMQTLKEIRDDAERNAVIRALSRANGNLSRAAELLGISRPTLYDLINRFGLKEIQR